MSDYSVRIERLSNGYTVRLDDPKIRKANQTGKGPWKDASREYAFDDIKKVLAFLGKNLDKALPEDDFDSSFDAAAAEDDDDDDE
jgi:hypothetical protein